MSGVKGRSGVYQHQPLSETHKKNIGLSIKGKRWAWKNHKCGYYAIHKWLHKELGHAEKCSFCGQTEGFIDWAKKKNTYYIKKLSNYIPLCRKCHMIYDGVNNK